METGVPGSHATTVKDPSQIGTMDAKSVDVSDSTTDLPGCDISSNSIPSECNIQTGNEKSGRDCVDGNDRNFEKDFPWELLPVLVVEAHQSGVNAVDVRMVKGLYQCIKMYNSDASSYNVRCIDLESAVISTITDVSVNHYLRRFNTIVIQGTPQMAADKEAISLSRVHSCYPNCNLSIF